MRTRTRPPVITAFTASIKNQGSDSRATACSFICMATTSSKFTEKTPLERIFGPDGWLARNHPRYEYRPGQLEMAEEVEAALR